MRKIWIALLLCATGSAHAQEDTVKASALINKATVYFGYGAELTHAARVTVSPKTNYIVIDNLSTQMDLNSLQISCPESVSLLSQQFSIYTPPPPPVTASVLTVRLRDSVARLQKEILAVNNKIDIDETVLTKSEKFIESAIATSGNKTELTTEVLKLVDYYNDKIQKNKKSIFENKQLAAELHTRIAELQTKIYSESAKPLAENTTPKTTGRVTLQVVSRSEEAAEIVLSYYTVHAGWQPLYDVRVNSKTNNLRLVYKASVTQNTGISWNKVKLTLSTGTPNFATAAPALNPLYLQLYAPQLYENADNKAAELSAITITNANGLKQALTGRVSGLSITPTTLEKYTQLRQGLLNTSFEIDLPYSIESTGLAHSINIKEKELKSTLKNYAVPKLDGDAYLLAEVADWENLDLIPGNANIITDDTYIGRSFIDPNTTADTLHFSLGKDKRVALKRTVVKDATTSKIKDADTRQTITCELTVKNNKVTDVEMLLKDQYPLSNMKEVQTELIEAGGSAVNAETGILAWKVNLKPGESRKFRFSYTVKYPKDKKILNLR